MEMFDTHMQSACFARKRDLDVNRLSDLEDEISKQIAVALNRPLGPGTVQRRQRYSKDPMAYAEFIRGYRLSSPGDPAAFDEAAQHLSNAVTRDPGFSLAHAAFSLVCAIRHFELDPASEWLEKAEFHCRRALELDPDLPEGHVASAILLWGPSKNFQHLEAIAELKRALALQNNQPHAYNRLGTILHTSGCSITLVKCMREGGHFIPGKPLVTVSCKSTSGIENSTWRGRRFERGAPSASHARGGIDRWHAAMPGREHN
jgi:hypothetical protein